MSRVELHDGFVRFIEAGGTAEFQLRWLRHHGSGAVSDAASATSEIAEVGIQADILHVRWAREQRTSRFPLRWLRDHAYAVERAESRPMRELVVVARRGTRRDVGAVAHVAQRHGSHAAEVAVSPPVPRAPLSGIEAG